MVPTRIWLDGDLLRWRRGRAPRRREAAPHLLNQFIGLTDAKSILRFAHTWGVLALAPVAGGGKMLRPGREIQEEGSEPIAGWQYYARRAAAVLNIAAALKQNKLGDLADWEQIGAFLRLGQWGPEQKEAFDAALVRHTFGMGWRGIVRQGTHEENLENAREVIAGEISAWLDCWKSGRPSGISDLALWWNQERGQWELRIDFHGLLFAALAMQLALVVADADSLYSCSGCGRPYLRARERKRPKRGWGNYCEACVKQGVAQRRAVSVYRGRKAAAVRMHRSGVGIAEIAEQLETGEAHVRRWVLAAEEANGEETEN